LNQGVVDTFDYELFLRHVCALPDGGSYEWHE
jgi:hypothetical protein